jgi:Fe-Mn family superoxide dismutase
MKNQIQNFIGIITEAENKKRIERIKLTYGKDDLEPVMSEETIDYHFGELYKTYCDRYNSGEGDPNFNQAGAFLHSIYFSQFKPPSGSNKPTGDSLDFIEKHFKSWDKFKEDFEKEAMAIQGSGWVYLSKNGSIKTIKNHQIKNDILLLVDWWEHAWALDYQSDKKRYLKNTWRIIDWSVINEKILEGDFL